MAVNWMRYNFMRNGKGLKINALTAGYLFLEEDGGLGKVLEVIDLERTTEQDAVDKLNGLGFNIRYKGD